LKTFIFAAPLLLGGCASVDGPTGDSSRYFQQVSHDEPNGQIFMPEPPASAGQKGIKVVRVSKINGKPVPRGTERTIRLAPGTYEVMFVQPGNRSEEIPVVMDIEPGSIYWCGWRDSGNGWEPVVYAIQDQ
jgi:hypothetical protein